MTNYPKKNHPCIAKLEKNYARLAAQAEILKEKFVHKHNTKKKTAQKIWSLSTEITGLSRCTLYNCVCAKEPLH